MQKRVSKAGTQQKIAKEAEVGRQKLNRLQKSEIRKKKGNRKATIKC